MITEILPDIPRLYTAIAEWLACMVYILLLKKRIARWQFLIMAAAGGTVIGGINYMAGLTHPTFWIGWMLIAFGSMLVFICVCSDLRLLDAGFYAIRAFILAEFAASFEWQIHIFFAEHRLDSWYVSAFFLIFIYGLIYTGMYMIERPHAKKGKDIQIGEKELLSSILMGVVVFLMSNISFVYQNTPFSGNMGREIFYIRTLVDLIGVVILYTQFEVLSEAALRRELEQMDSLFRRQYDQYRMSKENDEIIGRMYHDLKHQIAMIRAEEDADKKEVFLQEMDAAIRKYEAENKTGNHVLDTILSAKAMYCTEHDINFTCIADGRLVDFMNVMDICSVFGNALDNAIESAEKLAEPEKRLVSMSVVAQNEFVMLRFDNYYEEGLELRDGLPITTKKNKEYHGYGIRSIRQTAEKYGGTVTIHGENNWFSLRILFPAVS